MVAWIIEVSLSLTHLWCDVVKVLIVAMERYLGTISYVYQNCRSI